MSKTSELHRKQEGLELKFKERLVGLQKEVSSLKQRLTDINIDHSIKVEAPVAGRIAAIQSLPNHQANRNRPLMTILPEGSSWSIDLYVLSRAIGGITEGQRVLVRYSAFPYQKFGASTGTIKRVSRSVTMPSELENRIDVRIQEAIYMVSVGLDKQTVSKGGQEYELQSGMKVQADKWPSRLQRIIKLFF